MVTVDYVVPEDKRDTETAFLKGDLLRFVQERAVSLGAVAVVVP